VLSGFTPFGEFKANPSWEALKLAQARHFLTECEVRLVEVPTVFAGAFETLDEAVRSFAPSRIVCFGVHGSRQRDTFYLERIARNVDDSKAVDNAGEVRSGRIIVEGGPETLSSEYPVDDLREPLIGAGFSAEFSDNAGGFLCNHLYFRACHAYKGRIPCAFVHVPPDDSQGGVLALERLAQAVGIVARHAAIRPTLAE
jgi:pyroglutamyl-peptidase